MTEWSDVNDKWADGPQQPSVLPPDIGSADDEGTEAIHRLYETMQRAKGGDDPASAHHFEGMALRAAGRREEALIELIEAARMGLPQAMQDVADLLNEMGRRDESLFWTERAANAGSAAAIWNMGVRRSNEGDLNSAVEWFERSVEVGWIDGYAALTKLANDRGDWQAEKKWSKLGADAGQTFCIGWYGLLLLIDSEGDLSMTSQARDLLELAAIRGDPDARVGAVNANYILGEKDRGNVYVQMVVDSNDIEKINTLKQQGFL